MKKTVLSLCCLMGLAASVLGQSSTFSSPIKFTSNGVRDDSRINILGGMTSSQLAAALGDESGTGVVAFTNTPTFVTPNLGAAIATTINGVGIAGGTNTITLTRGTEQVLFTGGHSVTVTSTASTSVTLPTSGTLATLAGSEALTNKTINGNTVTSGTGTLNLGTRTLNVSAANTTVSVFGSSLVETANAPDARSILGIGTMGTETATDYAKINAVASNNLSITPIGSQSNINLKIFAKGTAALYFTPGGTAGVGSDGTILCTNLESGAVYIEGASGHGSFSILNSSSIRNLSDIEVVNLDNAQLIDDSTGYITLDWDSFTLYDSNGVKSSDWSSRTLNDSSTEAVSLNWDTRAAYSADAVTAISWAGRALYSDNEVATVLWSNGMLVDTGSVPSLSWQNREMYESSGTVVMNWNNGTIRDIAGGGSIDWFNWLLQYDGTTRLDWQNMSLSGGTWAMNGDLIATQITDSAPLDFPSIGALGTAELTISVTGANVGEAVALGPPATLTAGLIWCGRVASANTVTVRLYNSTGSAIDPASATWKATIIR